MTDRDKDILQYANGDPILIMETFRFILGEKIGQGCSRAVYNYVFDPNWVVKISLKFPFDNVLEHDIWHIVKDSDDAKWFAESKWISPSGHILLQRKTKPCTKLPDTLPDFFTDLKPDNFGYIGKQLVCHDYAYSMFRYIGLHKTKMVSTKIRK